jgi:quercetin dioxygenase-like cupin family protein
MKNAASSLGLVLLLSAQPTAAQPVEGGTCRPVAERTAEVGCWILAHQPLGDIDEKIFWHLDAFSTREAAEAVKTARGTVVETLGRVWLLTIEGAGWRPEGGQRIAGIGPLPTMPGQYSAQYMEAVFTPGMTSRTHTHAGPEAWHTVSGEMCLETPYGKQVGRAGGPPVIVPGGPPMHLTATGTEVRRALVLILHESAKPATTLDHRWAPTGLCKQ